MYILFYFDRGIVFVIDLWPVGHLRNFISAALILGAFVKFLISICMSVFISACPQGITRFTLDRF